MSGLPCRTVLLGVCGSSAADSSAHLLALVRKYIAADVKTICTPMGAGLTDLPTAQFLDDSDWNGAAHHTPLHIDLTVAAEEFIVCPATANTLAKSALGIADNLLTTCILAYRRPIWFAPFANQAMWANPVIQQHVSTLRARGHHVIDPQLMAGVGEARRTHGVGCPWPSVISALLQHYVDIS